MQTCSSHACIDDLEGRTFRNMGVPTQSGSMDWRTLPFDAKLYALTIIAIGGFPIVKVFPLNYSPPLLFFTPLIFALIPPAWEGPLSLSPNNHSTPPGLFS